MSHSSQATCVVARSLFDCSAFDQGLLKPICEVWPIDKLPEAVQKLKSGKVAGRCVVNYNA